MSELTLTLPNGTSLPFAQAIEMGRLIKEHKDRGERVHWHRNECECCFTIHATSCAYVIGPDGLYDTLPAHGCTCPDHAEGPMR